MICINLNKHTLLKNILLLWLLKIMLFVYNRNSKASDNALKCYSCVFSKQSIIAFVMRKNTRPFVSDNNAKCTLIPTPHKPIFILFTRTSLGLKIKLGQQRVGCKYYRIFIVSQQKKILQNVKFINGVNPYWDERYTLNNLNTLTKT